MKNFIISFISCFLCIYCTNAAAQSVSGSINGHNYVDLALPSKTLWSTCNIGANSPEKFGDYYAWGETKGYNSGKSTFSWDTYTLCDCSPEALKKYCRYPDYGIADGKTTLEAVDDVAHIKWGNDWKIPTVNQFAELIDPANTTSIWTNINDVYGRLITSNVNGNSIFFPDTHHFFNSSFKRSNSDGYYWSRSLFSNNCYDAFILYFDMNFVKIYGCPRCSGLTIRPVLCHEP